MKSLEEIIAATVDKAVERAMGKQRAQIKADVTAAVRQELASLNMMNHTEERLLTRKEAAARLIVSIKKLDELISNGEVIQRNTPGGRDKIVESSLNAYIQRLVKE